MIGTPSFFPFYSICFGKDKVRIDDGSYSSIAGKGCISVIPSPSLSLVLHVSNFTSNLLSVGHLKNFLNCSVTFFSLSLCVSRLGYRDDDW